MNKLHRLFAAGVVQYDLGFLKYALEGGVDPNGPIDVPKIHLSDGDEVEFDPWIFLISALSPLGDEFKSEWPAALETLAVLIEYGLDLSKPVSSSMDVPRDQWLNSQKHIGPLFVKVALLRRAHLLMDQKTPPALAPTRAPGRL